MKAIYSVKTPGLMGEKSSIQDLYFRNYWLKKDDLLRF